MYEEHSIELSVESQEMMQESLDLSDDAYTSHQESMIAEYCEYQGE